jgi:hypothetical protein
LKIAQIKANKLQLIYIDNILMWRCHRRHTLSLLALIIADTRSRPVVDQTMEITNLRMALADLVKRVADLDSSSKKTTGSTSLAQQWCSCAGDAYVSQAF